MIKNLLNLKNNRNLTIATFVFSASMIIGCKKKEDVPVVVPVKAPQAVVKPVQRLMSSPSVKVSNPAVGNQFDFSGKKDPFKPFFIAKNVATPNAADQKKLTRDSLPIHSFDISQFKLIGVITGGKENQAMVVDPNGKGYVLKSGMSIGKNDGRVVAVNANGVEVLEQFKDDNGRVRKENIRITLPRKQ